MIILITGGTSGIGENLAQNLSVNNTVIICGTNKNKLLKKRNSNITSYNCDVSDEKSVIKFSKLINVCYQRQKNINTDHSYFHISTGLLLLQQRIAFINSKFVSIY